MKKNPFLMSLAFCRIFCRLTRHKWGRANQETKDGVIFVTDPWTKRCLRCHAVSPVKRRAKKVNNGG